MNNIKKNKFIDECIGRLYENLNKSNYGTKYSWQDLKNLAGIDIHDKISMQRLYYIVNKASILLMIHNNRVLLTENRFGKRIINPQEHSFVAKKQIKKSAKIYRKAGYILAATELNQLTEEQKNEVIEDANKYRTLELFANQIIKKKGIVSKKTEDDASTNLMLDVIKLFSQKKE